MFIVDAFHLLIRVLLLQQNRPRTAAVEIVDIFPLDELGIRLIYQVAAKINSQQLQIAVAHKCGCWIFYRL